MNFEANVNDEDSTVVVTTTSPINGLYFPYV
jgi:hypothetical protein